MLGGKLKVESEISKGTTFYLTIPNIVIEKDSKDSFKENTQDKNSEPNLDGKTILIAEDTDLNYIILAKMLKNTKGNILWAKDGKEAIEMSSKHPKEIDVILMDIMMPNIDGYQAASEIKKVSSNIYIIAQTANILESEIQKVFDVGCDDYISKPIRKDLLFQALNKYLVRRKNKNF